jgi:hypothetical protein
VFALDNAVKDTGLIAAAMPETSTDATLMDAVAQQFRKAADCGNGREDMAAVIRAFRRCDSLTGAVYLRSRCHLCSYNQRRRRCRPPAMEGSYA